MLESLKLFCTDATAPYLGLFDFSIAPPLLLYSYIPILLLSLCIGIYVLFKDKFSNQSKLLFCLIISFSLFLINEIVLWVTAPVSIVMFSWQLALLLRFLILLSTVYFVYIFTKKATPTRTENIFLFVLSLPILLFLHTKLNTPFFNISYCEGENGPLWTYLYILEGAAILTFIFNSFYYTRKYLRQATEQNLATAYISVASLIFYSSFTLSQLYGEYLGVYEVNLYGPLGMLFFIFTICYVSVRYRLFSTKIAAPIALVFALWVLIFSLLFVHNIETIQLIVSITLVGLTIFGGALIRSIRREKNQREEIEQLASELERANVRLRQVDKLKSEFVSIASHQLRSPLTSISGYASLLREGTYGKLPEKMSEPVDRIEQSARLMAESIEDFLNVSRIESGNMKYHLSDFNLRSEVEHICDDTRPEALKKGLILLFRTDVTSKCIINADLGKVQQILHNLINNAIKYTPKGAITVFVRDNVARKSIFVEILDTGIGMNTETLHSIFQKFERGDTINTVNVKGTGLGLFVALKMAEAMSGTILAYSNGEGKGSRFVLELPLQM